MPDDVPRRAHPHLMHVARLLNARQHTPHAAAPAPRAGAIQGGKTSAPRAEARDDTAERPVALPPSGPPPFPRRRSGRIRPDIRNAPALRQGRTLRDATVPCRLLVRPDTPLPRKRDGPRLFRAHSPDDRSNPGVHPKPRSTVPVRPSRLRITRRAQRPGRRRTRERSEVARTARNGARLRRTASERSSGAALAPAPAPPPARRAGRS